MRKLNVTDRQTDRRTDGQTDGRTGGVAISPVPGLRRRIISRAIIILRFPASFDNPGQYSVAFHFRDWGHDLDMQIIDFRVTLRASPVSARTTDLSAEANFHTSPEEEGIFSRYVFLLYISVYLSCSTLCCSTTSFVVYITITNTTNN